MLRNGGIYMTKKQYSGIDIGKLICAILVIAAHTHPSLSNLWLDRGVKLLLKLAVPFFFTATGYLLIDHLDKERLSKYVRRILVLYLIWSLIYLPFKWPLSNPLRAIFITGVNSHLWYVPALVFSVVVVYLLHKKLRITQILVIASVFIIVGALLFTYEPITSKLIGSGGDWVFRLLDIIKPRNGLFYGFFYVALGAFLKQKKERPKVFYCVLLVVGLALVAIEGLIAVNKLHTNSTVLWLTCPIAVAGFFMICKTTEFKFETTIVRKMSSMIYFSHYIWIYILAWFGIERGMILFICVTMLSIISSYLIVRASERIKMLSYLY